METTNEPPQDSVGTKTEEPKPPTIQEFQTSESHNSTSAPIVDNLPAELDSKSPTTQQSQNEDMPPPDLPKHNNDLPLKVIDSHTDPQIALAPQQNQIAPSLPMTTELHNLPSEDPERSKDSKIQSSDHLQFITSQIPSDTPAITSSSTSVSSPIPNEVFIFKTFHVLLPPHLDAPASFKIVVAGNVPQLGQWKPKKSEAVLHQVSATHWMSNPVALPADVDIEYKYVITQTKWLFHSSDLWEAGQNHRVRETNHQFDWMFISEKNPNFQYEASFSSKISTYIEDIHKTIEKDVSKFSAALSDIVELETDASRFENAPFEISEFLSSWVIASSRRSDVDPIQLLFVCIAYRLFSRRHTLSFSDQFPVTFVLNHISRLGSHILKNVPTFIHKHLKSFVNDLIRSESRFSFDWLLLLDTYAPNFDSKLEFLQAVNSHSLSPNLEPKFLNNLENQKSKIEALSNDEFDRLFKILIFCSPTVVTSINLLSLEREQYADFRNENFSLLLARLKMQLEMIHHIFDLIPVVEAISKHPDSSAQHRVSELIFSTLHSVIKKTPASQEFSDNLLRLLKSGQNWLLSNPVAVFRSIISQTEYEKLIVITRLVQHNFFSSQFVQNLHENSGSLVLEWIQALHRIRRNSGFFILLRHFSEFAFALNDNKVFCDETVDYLKQEISKLSADIVLTEAPKIGSLESSLIRNVYIETGVQILRRRPEIGFLECCRMARLICGVGAKDQLQVDDDVKPSLILALLDLTRNKIPDVVTILKSEGFWPLIFGSAFTPDSNRQKVLSHVSCRRVGTLLQELSNSICSGKITMGRLTPVLEKSLENDLLFLCCKNGCQLSRDHLKEAHHLIRQHETHLNLLSIFSDNFCAPARVDCAELNQYLRECKSSFASLILELLRSPEKYWSKFGANFIKSALETAQMQQSSVFRSIFIQCFSPGNSLTMQDIALKISPEAMRQFDELLIRLSSPNCELSLQQLSPTWSGISLKGIKQEIQFLTKRSGKQQFIPVRVALALEKLPQREELSQRTEALLQLVPIFRIPNSAQDNFSAALQAFLTTMKRDNLPLLEFSVAVDQVLPFISKFSDENWGIVQELAMSTELVDFLKSTPNDDMRHLIDAVEEHSDQFIREDTVSYLIEVKRFLQPFLQNTNQSFVNLDKFVHFLNQHIRKLPQSGNLATKIKVCNENIYGLKRTYGSLANRGEVTKEIVQKAVAGGTYCLSVQDDTGECTLTLTYTSNNSQQKQARYSLDELQDLRSRALLIVNSEKKTRAFEAESSSPSIEMDRPSSSMSQFIKHIDDADQTREIIKELHFLGHPQYRTLQRESPGKELSALCEELRNELEWWKEILKRARAEHESMLFFHSSQIWSLYTFFSGFNESEESNRYCEDLLRFYAPTLDSRGIKRPLPPIGAVSTMTRPQLGTAMDQLGTYLDSVLQQAKSHYRVIANIGEARPGDVVLPNRLFVARVEDPLRVINVVMSLYINNGAFPDPSTILFCRTSTTMEEILLLLRRCFSPIAVSKKQLFCVVNVENLSFDLQEGLINEIRRLQAEFDQVHPYLLALVCCSAGAQQQHIIEEFHAFVKDTQGVSNERLFQLFTAVRPETFVISSDVPGLGKTETLRAMAMNRTPPLTLLTFPIGDQVNMLDVVKRLRQFRFSDFQVLHLDISSVSDVVLVTTLLFELLIVGSVASGTLIYHLPGNCPVFIEIANTINHGLLISLPICMCFKNQNLSWDINRLIISSEILSPMQIVCNYLAALDSKSLLRTNISFIGANATATVLNAQQCRQLIQRHFLSRISNMTPSFAILNAFIRVFARQLLMFSNSTYFSIQNLTDMGGELSVRENLVTALLQAALEFSTRSISPIKSAQTMTVHGPSSAAYNSSDSMVERVKGMVRWAETNHLIVTFNSLDFHTVSVLYREMSAVPKNIVDLLQSQHFLRGGDFHLDDFSKMTHKELLERLERICRISPFPSTMPFPDYVLTADNLLKMLLLLLRIRAGIPVVIMGETGCGKTSLISFLAICMEINLKVMNFHAGISRDSILQFIRTTNDLASKSSSQLWVFLDEINTCDHLALLNEIITRRTCLGEYLHSNVRILAACNPYRRLLTIGLTSGLISKLGKQDEQSKLVYRVHPLPEPLLDFVWDYGTLDPKDERAYIFSMVKDMTGFPIDIVVSSMVSSQAFIRDLEEASSVSLRDVKRCKQLILWFLKSLQNRPQIQKKSHIASLFRSEPSGQEIHKRAIILGLGHCFHSRICSSEKRKEYRAKISALFSNTTEKDFENIVLQEQRDILQRMDLPPGIAQNSALLENVFVIMTCILNKIPVFVVGRPGCSKSLSMQLINSNLRGPDSKDEFFRKLPQVYVVAYQGSESSTSEGILKVFDKARKYLQHNNKQGVIPVVLLDEVGLAEISKHNPLKVLHNLLESEENDVAVVGISNWALDAAKMNRAIHLSRPDPDAEDLYKTGQSIQDGLFEKAPSLSARRVENHELRSLAEAYHEYQGQQKKRNFHGLRDYYSLIKCLLRLEESNLSNWGSPSDNFGHEQSILLALERNFGGMPSDMNSIQMIFLKHLGRFEKKPHVPTSVLKLIQDNLQDRSARHLMLITNHDSAISILEQSLRLHQKDPVIIFGSQFEEDQAEQYSYRILSRIILCMESGRVLILKDLDHIYGSLYDMLNQNYTIVGKKKNCRIALGAFSNPMCHVHDDFRCIILTEETKVDFTDPPFLNRFEKQLLTFDDILSPRHHRLLEALKCWVEDISSIEPAPHISGANFRPNDMFVGLHSDTLPSLVLLHSNQEETKSDEQILEQCKNDLIWISNSDAIVRSPLSRLGQLHPDEVGKWKRHYFEEQHHQDFCSFVSSLLAETTSAESGGFRAIVMSYSNIHTNIAEILENIAEIRVRVEKLGTFKSEKQLAKRIQSFWHPTSPEDLFVLQCDHSMDSPHFLLARTLLDQHRNEYFKSFNPAQTKPHTKHVLIIVHTSRHHSDDEDLQLSHGFNFLNGWRQALIDSLQKGQSLLSTFLKQDMVDLLSEESGPISFESVIGDILTSCFLCIRYPSSQVFVDYIHDMVARITNDPLLLDTLKSRVLHEMGSSTQSWQSSVACDHRKLIECRVFEDALRHSIHETVSKTLSKLIFALEKEGALRDFFSISNDSLKREEWFALFNDPAVINLSNIASPTGPDCYHLNDLSLVELHFPFSRFFVRQIDTFKEMFDADRNRLMKDHDHQIDLVDADQQVRFHNVIDDSVPRIRSECFQTNLNDYFSDFFSMKSSINDIPPSAVRSILRHFFDFEQLTHPFDIHMMWWKCADVCMAHFKLISSFRTFFEPAEFIKLVEEAEIAICESESLAILPAEAFGQLMISTLSKYLIPTSESLKKLMIQHLTPLNTVVEWHRLLNLGLSQFVFVCSNDPPPEIHILRMLNDFTSTFIIPGHLNMKVLMDVALKAQEQGMGSPQFLKFFAETLTTLTPSDNPVLQTLFHRFFAHLLGRILDFTQQSSDDSIVSEVISHVFSSDQLLLFVSPVILRLTRAFRDFDEEIFFEGFAKHERIETRNENLKCLEEALKKNEFGPESKPAVVLADIIQEDFFEESVHTAIENGDLSLIGNLIEKMENAVLALTDPNSGCLKTVCASAFLKSFFRRISTLLHEQSSPIILKGILTHLNLALEEEKSVRVNAIRVAFLRQLRRDLSIPDLKQLCQNNREIVPWLDRLQWNEDSQSRLGFNPFLAFNEFPFLEMDTAFSDVIVKSNTNRISAILKTNASQPTGLLAFLGFVMTRFYFVYATRELNHREKTAIDIIQALPEFQQLSPNVIRVVNCLMRNTFKSTLLQLTPAFSTDQIRICSVVIHSILISVALSNEPANALSPLIGWASSPLARNHNFVLTTPSDETAMILGALKDATARYRCSCGFFYVVGNCGRPTEDTSCPRCKTNKIGGLNHNLHANNSSVDPNVLSSLNQDKPGYLSEKVEGIRSTQHSVRGMTPTSFRVLHFLLHSMMLGGQSFGLCTDNDLAQILKDSSSIASKYLLDHINQDWDILLKQLNLNSEDLSRALHQFLINLWNLVSSPPTEFPNTLTTSQARSIWEQTFSKCVMETLAKDPQQYVKHFVNSMREKSMGHQTSSLLESSIDELAQDNSAQFHTDELPRLLRMTLPRSKRGFKTFYNSDAKNRTSFPFLNLFFSSHKQLRFVQHIRDLVSWSNLVDSRLAHRISREEAHKMSIMEFIEKEVHPSKRDALESCFKRFEHAWNEVRPIVNQYECEEIQLPEMDKALGICYCCLDTKGNGSLLWAALQTLCQIQNQFLERVLELSNAGCQSLKYLERSTGISGMRSCKAQEIEESDMICFEWNDDIIIKYSMNIPEYGNGKRAIYDCEKIEIELAQITVAGKAHIDTENVKFMQYHLEIFHAQNYLLGEVSEKVPQQPLTPSQIRRICESPSMRDLASQVHSSLGMVLCFLKRTGGDPHEYLLQYFGRWIDGSTNSTLRLCKVCDEIQLQHVRSLYEALEDLLAEDLIHRCLPECFRQPLSPELERSILELINNTTPENKRIDLEPFLGAIRRFSFRYLLSNSKLSPDNDLGMYFSHDSAWPLQFFRDGLETLFPENLQIAHIYRTYNILVQELKRRTQEASILASGAHFGTASTFDKKKKSTTSMPPQKKKKSLQFF